MLVGDVPNVDKSHRFLLSDIGKRVHEEYELQVANEDSENIRTESYSDIEGIYTSSDADILRLMGDLRKQGFETYLLPQAGNMPTGFTREDLLIKRF